MNRIKPVSPDTASGETKTILDAVRKKIGKVPNFFQNLANSLPVLQAYMTLSDIANKTSLSPKLQEQIALTVSQVNECNYCLAAHSTISRGAGLAEDEILQARKGQSNDPKTKAILQFAKLVVEEQGQVSDEEVETLKKAGVSNKEIPEIVLVIMISMFTNYFNHITDPEIDFPKVSN